MGIVRKQSIQSSLFIYIGFAIGAFNFWLLPHILETEQFGLVRLLMSFSTLFAGICSLGMQQVIVRFYPYFDNNGKVHKTDFLSWTFLIALAGFLLYVVLSFFFHDLIIRKFSKNAALFVDYFYLTYPFILTILFFGLFEKVALSRQYAVRVVFLRETGVRLFTSLLVVALALGWLHFKGFISFYSLQYGVLLIPLIFFLFHRGSGFDLKISRTTRRLYKHMGMYGLFVFGIGIFRLVEQQFNTILLGSRESLTTAGVFDIAFFIATVITIPKRGMQNAAIASIARAWKENDLGRINRVYKKSAATLLIGGLFIFGLIWLNLDDIFKLYKPEYSSGKYVVLIIGLANIVDLALGLNGEILANSRIWKLNFILNVILVAIFLVVTYLMVVQFGIMGSAYGIFISLVIYNLMRLGLIWWKYKILPFTLKTLLILLTGIASYFIVFSLLPPTPSVFLNLILRSTLFSLLFMGMVLIGNLSEDLTELWKLGKEKLGL